ncbi:MAG TPA: WbqC family protein [Cyclobacteriaceae bacterium]|jgi:hypothetical protein|nr:WbqC family protein [Cyclobacteriaceae bacterium]
MQPTLLIETHYLPSLEYFCALLPFEKIKVETNEHFTKQSLRNRCFVNTAQGKKMLTVPLLERHGKVMTKHVLIEQGNKWRNTHWRTIESAYRKAPYFDYYFEELKGILYKNHERLLELNRDLMSFCLRHTGFQKNISETMAYDIDAPEGVLDLRSVISSKNPFEDRPFYVAQTYYQVFGSEFVPNLSIIDLLFCEGPRAGAILRASSSMLNK